MKLLALRASITCAVALACVTSAHAQWPDRPITIVVPFSAGGNTDSIARITAAWLTQKLNQSVIVDNKPGANGALAAEYVARAKGDGYTLFMATAPQMVILPHLQKVRYDPVKSFVPVSIIATNSFALALAPNSTAKTLADVVKEAKTKPGDVAYGSAGNGSVSHLTMALFLQRAGITMNHVPYKGGAPAIADLLGGQTELYFGNVAESLPQYKAGKLKVLAVSGTKRVPQMPNVPTIAEQGYPGFSTNTWNAISAPAGTPPEVIQALANAIEHACQDAGFLAKLEGIGVDPLCDSPSDYAKVMATDLPKWAEAVRISGAKLD